MRQLREPTPTGPIPRRTHSRHLLLGVSATTFLALCVWIGPDAACWLIGVAAFVAGWVWLCRRSPYFSYFTGVLLANVIGGFISGLFGFSNRGGSAYYRTPRRRRRR